MNFFIVMSVTFFIVFFMNKTIYKKIESFVINNNERKLIMGLLLLLVGAGLVFYLLN